MKYLNQKIENESKKENKMNYKDKAIRCVKDTILPMQRKQFEECGYCLDKQYQTIWEYRMAFRKDNRKRTYL